MITFGSRKKRTSISSSLGRPSAYPSNAAMTRWLFWAQSRSRNGPVPTNSRVQ